MKFALALILIACVVDVKPFAQELGDMVFKKYAIMKICEDCYGKETVKTMLTEVGLAYAKCRGKPSILPLLEQAFVTPSPNPNPAPSVAPTAAPSVAPTAAPSTAPTAAPSPPMEEPVPVPVTEANPPIREKPPVYVSVENLPFKYNQQDLFRPYYGYPNGSPYQQRFPSYPSFYNGHPAKIDYRWKRNDKEPLAVDPEQSEELPVETSQSFTFGSYLANKFISKHQTLLGNMTCVLKEMKFIDDDMQPNYESIRGRIHQLPVAAGLKDDLLEGIEMCKEFSTCIPAKSSGANPMITSLVRPYAFFKCFKGRKVEACMKKDMREKLGGILAGLSASGEMIGSSRSPKGQARSLDGEETLSNIFNMVYGFDMESSSIDSFF